MTLWAFLVYQVTSHKPCFADEETEAHRVKNLPKVMLPVNSRPGTQTLMDSNSRAPTLTHVQNKIKKEERKKGSQAFGVKMEISYIQICICKLTIKEMPGMPASQGTLSAGS